MKILIADDHPIVRHGLKQMLAGQIDITAFGEASNAREVFENLSTQDWDILILDISMPDRSGLDILGELKSLCPKLPVLILSVHPEELYAIRVLKAGAAGYMTKLCVPEELVKAVKKVVEGGKYISSSLTDRIALNLVAGFEKRPHEALSDREYRVAFMIASGKNLKVIAKELSLSVKTVRAYRASIFEKMKVKSNPELIRYALKNRLID